MLTYYIEKKSTVNIKAQINIKADILQFLNGRKKPINYSWSKCLD